MKLSIICPKCRQEAFKLDGTHSKPVADAVCARCRHVFTEKQAVTAIEQAGLKVLNDATAKLVRDFNKSVK